MVDRIEGDGSGNIPSDTSPKAQRKMYEAEYKHAASLFERSLDEFSNCGDNIYKKEAFRKVMDQSMQVLRDTSAALKHPEVIQQIEKDYANFQAKETAEAQAKLYQDLEKAKNSLK